MLLRPPHDSCVRPLPLPRPSKDPLLQSTNFESCQRTTSVCPHPRPKDRRGCCLRWLQTQGMRSTNRCLPMIPTAAHRSDVRWAIDHASSPPHKWPERYQRSGSAVAKLLHPRSLPKRQVPIRSHFSIHRTQPRKYGDQTRVPCLVLFWGLECITDVSERNIWTSAVQLHIKPQPEQPSLYRIREELPVIQQRPRLILASSLPQCR